MKAATGRDSSELGFMWWLDLLLLLLFFFRIISDSVQGAWSQWLEARRITQRPAHFEQRAMSYLYVPFRATISCIWTRRKIISCAHGKHTVLGVKVSLGGNLSEICWFPVSESGQLAAWTVGWTSETSSEYLHFHHKGRGQTCSGQGHVHTWNSA